MGGIGKNGGDKKGRGGPSPGEEARDKDSLDRLPLSGMPLSNNALKGARLVKNVRMETAVEIHNDPVSGSLQIAPEKIADFIAASPRDRELIRSLAGLNSFDVYSLRSSLQRLGVEVEDVEALDLSEDMKADLTAHSAEFVRPLVEKIFGAGREDLHSSDGLQLILRDPDMARVRENLRVMSQRTGIPLAEIPAFLKDYSEVYISVAYYRYGFDNVRPDIDSFLSWIGSLQQQQRRGGDAVSARAIEQCRAVEETVRFLSRSLAERLARIQEDFMVFWSDISPASFAAMRTQIEANHMSLGAVLCGLIVKMNAWKRAFPETDMGGPVTRQKFILTEFEPGLSRLRMLETDARERLMLPLTH